jgi:glycosyltransferase involved in cell wall biosynthesis
MAPSISVVTVTLNVAPVLPRLLSSLRKQTDRSFDFILIDGLSTDDTWQLAQEAKDLVTASLHEADCGVYDALNKAIRRVRSDYYLVMGADDTLYPDAIENYKKVADETGADVIVAGVKVGDRVHHRFHPKRGWLGHSAMIASHSVGMLIRRNIHDVLGEYPMRYPVLADGYIIKKLFSTPTVKVVKGHFVAGEFCSDGLSNRSLIRALCETWQIQMDTGERPVVQYLLFQSRLIKYLPKIIGRS